MVCQHTKWFSSSVLPALDFETVSMGVRWLDVEVLTNINHPKEECNVCKWTEKLQDEKNVSYEQTFNEANCEICGSKIVDDYYLDWVPSKDAKAITKDGWFWDNLITKYEFGVIPNSYGKFNLVLNDEGDETKIDPYWNSTVFSLAANITIDKKYVNGTQLNFPWFVYLNSTNFPNITQVSTDCSDIRIVNTSTEGGGSEIPFGIEKCNAPNNITLAFRVSALNDTTNTTYSIYFKNTTAVTTTANMKAVWDSNTTAVWLMNETTGNFLDSGPNSLPVSATAVTTRYGNRSGTVDGSGNFSTANDAIKVPDNALLNFGDNQNFTVSFIFNNNGVGGTHSYMLYTVNTNGWYVSIGEDKAGAVCLHTYAPTHNRLFTGGNDYADEIQYVSITRAADTGYIYMNGSLDNSSNIITSDTYVNSDYLQIGGVSFYPFERDNKVGLMDMAIFSNISRSASWINTTYLNEKYVYEATTIGVGNSTVGSTDLVVVTTIITPTNTTYNLTSPIPYSFNCTQTNGSTLNINYSVSLDNVIVGSGVMANGTTANGNLVPYVGIHNMSVTCLDYVYSSYNTTQLKYFTTVDWNVSSNEILTSGYENTPTISNLTIDTDDAINNISASYYNGTGYMTPTTFISGDQYNFTQTYHLPTVTVNYTNLSIFWNFTIGLQNGSYVSSNTTNTTQSIYQSTMRIRNFDESNGTQYCFNATANNGTIGVTITGGMPYNVTWNSTFPHGNVSLKVTSVGVSCPATVLVPVQRSYQLIWDATNKEIITYTLLSINAVTYNVVILDYASNPLPNALVTAGVYFTNNWSAVEQEVSDSTGSTLFWLDTNTYYQINVSLYPYSNVTAYVQPSGISRQLFIKMGNQVNATVNVSTPFDNITAYVSPNYSNWNSSIPLEYYIHDSANSLVESGWIVSERNTSGEFIIKNASSASADGATFTFTTPNHVGFYIVSPWFTRTGHNKFTYQNVSYSTSSNTGFNQDLSGGYGAGALELVAIIITFGAAAFFCRWSLIGGGLIGLVVMAIFTFGLGFVPVLDFGLTLLTLLAILLLRSAF